MAYAETGGGGGGVARTGDPHPGNPGLSGRRGKGWGRGCSSLRRDIFEYRLPFLRPP